MTKYFLILLIGLFLSSCGSSDAPVSKSEFQKTKELMENKFPVTKDPIQSNCNYLSIDQLYEVFKQDNKREWLKENNFEFVLVEGALRKNVKSPSDLPANAKLMFGSCRLGEQVLDYANILELRNIPEGQLEYKMASKTVAWPAIRKESEAGRDPWLVVKEKPLFWKLQDELIAKGAEVKYQQFNAGGNFFWKDARFQFNHVTDRYGSERYSLDIYPLDTEGKGPINESGPNLNNQ